MALTSAQKQARYRQKHLAEGDERRVQVVVSLDVAFALQRLARHRGTTQASVLSDLIMAEKNRVTASMSDEQFDVFVGE